MLRTDRDLSMKLRAHRHLALVVVIAFASPLYVGGTGIMARIWPRILIIVFGFLFVTVSSRLTGEIGSSSNPISGMTVATLLLTCLTFVILGWTGSNYFVTALSIGAIVCIAASNGGTTSQDLKTGFLVGSTPRNQQIAILIGALVSALAARTDSAQAERRRIGVRSAHQREPTSGDVGGQMKPGEKLALPSSARRSERRSPRTEQHDGKDYLVWHRRTAGGGNAREVPRRRHAARRSLLRRSRHQRHPQVRRERPGGAEEVRRAEGDAHVLHHQGHPRSASCPWGLVLLGAMIAIVLEMSGIPSLAFAVGVYLPLSSSSSDLHRRHDSLARGQVDREEAPRHAI